MTAARARRPGRPSPDLTGRRFTRYVALERAMKIDHRSRWRCRCDCGAVKVVLACSLLDGTIKSCGCLRADNARNNGYRAALKASAKRRQRTDDAITGVFAPRVRVNIPARSRKIGGGKADKTARIAQAFGAVFKVEPDYVHVDTPGARVVRGSRY